jgi:hypothetical protein
MRRTSAAFPAPLRCCPVRSRASKRSSSRAGTSCLIALSQPSSYPPFLIINLTSFRLLLCSLLLPQLPILLSPFHHPLVFLILLYHPLLLPFSPLILIPPLLFSFPQPLLHHLLLFSSMLQLSSFCTHTFSY